MKNKKISAEQMVELISMFNEALLLRNCSKIEAKQMIDKKAKIRAMVFDLFGLTTDYTFFDYKFLPRYINGQFSIIEGCENDNAELMTPQQSLKLSEIFIEALFSVRCFEQEVNKVIAQSNILKKSVDDLFEMSPAFNIFEYKTFVRRAPLSCFREVSTWDHNIFIVCTADEVCEPYGFKSGDIAISSHSSRETIIGVAPFGDNSDGQSLKLFTANENDQFRYPEMPVVGVWGRNNIENNLTKINF